MRDREVIDAPTRGLTASAGPAGSRFRPGALAARPGSTLHGRAPTGGSEWVG